MQLRLCEQGKQLLKLHDSSTMYKKQTKKYRRKAELTQLKLDSATQVMYIIT